MKEAVSTEQPLFVYINSNIGHFLDDKNNVRITFFVLPNRI